MERWAWWKRALAAALVHFALLLSFPAVRWGYAPFFRTFGELAVRAIDPLPGPIDARFEPGSGGPLAEDLVAMDTVVQLQHREFTGAGSFGASSFYHGYWPTSVLIALFLVATPRPLRRTALVLAFALLHAFIAAR